MKTTLTKILILCFAFLSFTSPTTAQKAQPGKSWEDKNIAEWDETDVKTILRNSPWGKILEGGGIQLGGAGLNVRALFTLRSALIVRYADVRAEQLKLKFDSLDEKAKAEFIKKFKPVLDCSACERSYIVGVVGDSDLFRQPALVKNRAPRIFLSNENGERRELSNFSPQTIPGSEALFFFPRYDTNGKPLVTPANKTLIFTIVTEPEDDSVVQLLRRVEIKVSDIVREGQVIF